MFEWVACGIGCIFANPSGRTLHPPPTNPIPFRPLISHPPTGTNGTTPCGVGNPMWPGPGVAPGTAQPRAVWHNVVDVGGGEMMRAMTHYVHGNAAGGGRSPFPLRESPRPCLAPSPSGNPNGIMTVGMDVDQVPHPETPEDGPSPFPLRESPRSCLAPSPSGNPEGILPQSPRLRRRGATRGACPTYHQP